MSSLYDPISDGDKISTAWGNTVEDLLGSGKPLLPASYVVWYDSVAAEFKARNGATGVIDYKGANAATVIQAVHDALTTGGRIFLRRGEYSIGATLTIDNMYVEMFGEGPGATTGTILKLADSADVNLMELDNATFFHLHNLKLDGNSANNTSGIGISADNTEGGSPTADITIDRCFIADFPEENLYWTDCWGGVIRNSYIEAGDGDYGMYCAAYNNIFESTTFNYNDCDAALRLAGDGKLSMIGCAVADNQKDGIQVTGGEKTIIGCVIAGNGRDTVNTYDGIVYSGGDKHVLMGNTIDGKTLKQSPNVDASKYGVDVGAGIEVTIIGNTFENMLTASMNLADTTPIVRMNNGFVTENSGSDSIANGTSAKVVAHGLDVTPLAEHFTIMGKENPTNDVGTIWIDTIGAANFTVNVEADPGASNWDFGWRVEVLY